jgi:hypothetical protein
MTMSASVVLSSLPRDAHRALADAEAVDTGKGKKLRHVGITLEIANRLILTRNLCPRLTLNSDCSLSASSFSSYSEESGFQDQCVAEIRNRCQVPQEEA